MTGSDKPNLLVVIPIYNDWEAVALLLVALDRELALAGVAADVLLVDDGSTTLIGDQVSTRQYKAIVRIDVLGLRRNIGHQRAIAIALAYAHDRRPAATVLVMDGDGEDAPNDVPRLLARMEETGNRSVIFAARQRRSETFVFRIFYWLFRTMHRALTGIPVRVGNFSVIPASLVGRLVVVSELWNHYAAAVFKARLPRDSVPTVRGHRLMGESRMNFVALVSHGLSALSVHAEVIGVRLLVVSVVIAAGVVGLIAVVVALRLSTSMAIPGWATNAGGLLVLFLFETVAAAVFFIFLVLHSRSQPLFIPIRDYAFFIEGARTVYPADGKTDVAASSRP
jgi:polyisoprenyl-phosphate glycosyltransferase